MRKIALFVVAAYLGAVSAFAQPAQDKKSFEVASVKLAGPLDPQKILSGRPSSASRTR